MSTKWQLIGLVAAANFTIKSVGPVLAGRRRLPPRLQRLVVGAVPALVAALVVTGTFASGPRLVLDERSAGLAVACLAVALRAPALVVLLAAAVTTALLRALLA